MAYQKHLWVAKEKVTADKLNHIEEGIANAGEGGGGGSFSVDSAGVPGICDLAVRNDPPFIKFKLKDNYTEDELSQWASFDLNWENTTPDNKIIFVNTNSFNGAGGITVEVGNSDDDSDAYVYLSDEAAEWASQTLGIAAPAHVWVQIDMNSQDLVVLDHAPELKFSTDFDAYMFGRGSLDLLEEGMYSVLAHIIFNADGSFKEHYTKEDEANLQGLIDAEQVLRQCSPRSSQRANIDIAEPGNPDGDITNTISTIFTRSSQMMSLMSGEGGIEYERDYFPMIFAPHFGMSDEDTYVYIYVFAGSVKKMCELFGPEAGLPVEPDRWYKMTAGGEAGGEFTPVTVPDVDAPDNVHDYLYLDTLFDCSEIVAAYQKVLVKRARKNHIIPMGWYGTGGPDSEEFRYTRAEGDIDCLYSNFYENILGLTPNAYRLESAISVNSGWQNAIEFGCWVNSIQLDLTLANGGSDNWQYSWFDHFANSVLCGDKVRLFFSRSDFGGMGQPNIRFEPTNNSYVEIGLASGGPSYINTYADFTSAQRLSNQDLVLHGHLPVIVSAVGQTNEEEPQNVFYNNENFLVPVSLLISGEARE